MFDNWGAAEPFAPGGANGSDGAALPGGSDGPEAVAAALSGMVPGTALAGVVERAVAPLLAPAAASADDGGAGPVGSAAADGPGGAGLSGAGAGERVLAAAAGSLVVDGGRGVEAVTGLGAEVLSELVAACGRLAGWAQWAQAVIAACMARCPEMSGLPYQPPQPDRDDQDGERGGVASPSGVAPAGRWNATGEVACRVGVSRLVASRMVDRGAGLLDARLGPVSGMHRVGLLDSSKTSVLVSRLAGESAGVAEVVQARVLGRAVHRTAAGVGRDVDKALTALDPAGAGRRVRRNTAGRHVSRPREAGAGVCEMRALLPRPDAVLLDATLDALAASARAAGDERTPGQLRADALVAMTLHTLRTTHHTATAPGNRPAEATAITEDESATVEATGPAATGPAGAADADDTAAATALAAPPVVFTGFESPSDTAGPAGTAGPTAAGEPLYIDAMGLTPDGVPLEGLLTALSGLVCHTSPWWTPSGAGPVPLPPGLTVHVDVTVPLDHLTCLLDPQPDNDAPPGDGPPRHRPPGTGPETGSPGTGLPAAGTPGTGASADASPACGPCACAQARPAEAAEPARPAESVGTVASRGSERQGVPVPAAVVTALATGGTWRRLVTDPLSGTVIDVGRTRYRPPAALADLVRARDASCTHPGCERPARGCDLDHIRPWEAGGATSLENLTSLCRAHHRLKHTPGWALTRTPHGALIWRTPTGARYRRENDGTITLLPRRTGPRQHARSATRVPETLASAITPETLDRLHKGLTDQTGTTATGLSAAAGDAVGLGPGRQTRPVITAHGPRPGENPGDYETTPYHPALHTLGLSPLLDTIPPF